MENAKQLLYDTLVEEFNTQPTFLLARTLFLFCHLNPAFEMPSDIMQKFIHGLMDDEVRAFSLMYPIRNSGRQKLTTGPDEREAFAGTSLENREIEIFNDLAAQNLSHATGKTYTASMVDKITAKFKGIMSFNEILEVFIMASARKRAVNWEVSEFTGMLKSFPVFSPLNENELYDLFTLLQFKQYNPDEIILRKGDPGKNLYIVLTGKVDVVGDEGESISILESGGIFGEMSLLTGAPVGTSVYSRGMTKLAVLTSMDFKHVLHKYPVLHIFFYRLLIERAGRTSRMLGNDISSGMTGDIANVHVIELFQMINTSQKTGTVGLKLKGANARIYFRDGEIVHAEYKNQKGRRAVFALLGMTSGKFIYTPGIPPEADAYETLGGFMGLVMEGMQRLDEETDMLEKV